MGTSNIFVGGKELANYTSSTDKLSLTSSVDFPSGHILQVICGVEREVVTDSDTGWNDLPSDDMTLTITLSSASNKVLVLFNAQVAQISGWTPVIRIVRNKPSADTIVTAGTSSDTGTGPQGLGLAPGYSAAGPSSELIGHQGASFLDTPNTTDPITYKCQWYGRTDSSGKNLLNRMDAGYQAYYGKGVSSLTLFELKA